MGPHDVYLANQALIERALVLVCRRQQLSRVDADDYCSAFRLHLMEDGYAAIRAFRGRSSLQTFLLVVMTRFYQDWRNARWGKWRPSADSRRYGAIGVHLETLIVRDGLSFNEAFETLKPKLGESDTRVALQTLADGFRPRHTRTPVSEAVLGRLPAAGSASDAPLARREAVALAVRAAVALDAALARLPADDRLLLRMRYEDDVSVADIARALTIDQKALYGRLRRLLDRLRTALTNAGLDAADATEVLQHRGFDGADAAHLIRAFPSRPPRRPAPPAVRTPTDARSAARAARRDSR